MLHILLDSVPLPEKRKIFAWTEIILIFEIEMCEYS